MEVQQAYNLWADQYDTNVNRTRDLEAVSLRKTLASITFDTCLEIGCGTGKNTEWLVTKAKEITAVDLSEEMLAKAKAKIMSENVRFCQADINHPWLFVEKPYDLVTFSLVLEHIEHLHPVLHQAANALNPGGYVYIGELHPFKQYTGTKARFETPEGVKIVSCYTHHLTDFTYAALENGFKIESIDEFFDDGQRDNLPRILTLVLKKL